MSGDCTEQPVIFYSEEMTEAKIFLLRHHGVVFKNREYYFNNDDEDYDD
tara:strand:- start:772 stop:918 length:147 start_codon:yes stop_codon:yes gene_type:complete